MKFVAKMKRTWWIPLLAILAGGCAVLTVDVDVYKGSLTNQRDVQTEQLAVMAISARPLLKELRNKLELQSSTNKNVPGFTDYLRTNDTIYFSEPLRVSISNEKCDDEKRKKLDPKYRGDVQVQYLGTNLASYVGTNLASYLSTNPVASSGTYLVTLQDDRAIRVNSLLSLYENRTSENIKGIRARFASLQRSYTNAYLSLNGTNTPNQQYWDTITNHIFTSETITNHSIILQITSKVKDLEAVVLEKDLQVKEVEAKLGDIRNQVKELEEKKNAETSKIKATGYELLIGTLGGTQNLLNKSLDAFRSEKSKTEELIRRLRSCESQFTDKYFTLEQGLKVLLAASPGRSQRQFKAFIDANDQMIYFLLQRDLEFLTHVPYGFFRLPQESDTAESKLRSAQADGSFSAGSLLVFKDRRVAMEVSGYIDGLVIKALEMQAVLQALAENCVYLNQLLSNKNNFTGMSDADLAAIQRTVIGWVKWINNFSQTPVDNPYVIAKRGIKMHSLYEVFNEDDFARDKNGNYYFATLTLEGLDRLPPTYELDIIWSRFSKQTQGSDFDAGRGDDGLEQLIENYLAARASASTNYNDPAKVESLLRPPREQLLDALVHFAQDTLVVANFHTLLGQEAKASSRPSGDPKGHNPSQVTASDPPADVESFTRVLQAIGNSILVQVDELRQHQDHDSWQEKKRAREAKALSQLFGTNHYLLETDCTNSTSKDVIDLLITQLKYELILETTKPEPIEMTSEQKSENGPAEASKKTVSEKSKVASSSGKIAEPKTAGTNEESKAPATPAVPSASASNGNSGTNNPVNPAASPASVVASKDNQSTNAVDKVTTPEPEPGSTNGGTSNGPVSPVSTKAVADNPSAEATTGTNHAAVPIDNGTNAVPAILSQTVKSTTETTKTNIETVKVTANTNATVTETNHVVTETTRTETVKPSKKAKSAEIKSARMAKIAALKEAIKLAEEYRAGEIYLRPASTYLRSSYPATSVQQETRQDWVNMLQEHGWRQFPLIGGRSIDSDKKAKLIAEIDKQSWQNINQVRVAGGGNVNYVLAKDDVGNWYVKSYSSNPKDIIESAKNLAFFAAGPSLGAQLPIQKAGTNIFSASGQMTENTYQYKLLNNASNKYVSQITNLYVRVQEKTKVETIGQDLKARWTQAGKTNISLDACINDAKLQLGEDLKNMSKTATAAQLNSEILLRLKAVKRYHNAFLTSVSKNVASADQQAAREIANAYLGEMLDDLLSRELDAVHQYESALSVINDAMAL